MQACIRIAYSQADNAELLWHSIRQLIHLKNKNFDMEQLFVIRDVMTQSPFPQCYTYRKGSIDFHGDMQRHLIVKAGVVM